MIRIFVATSAIALSGTQASAQEQNWGLQEVHSYVSAFEPRSQNGPVDPFTVPTYPDAPTGDIVIKRPIMMSGRWNSAEHNFFSPGSMEYDAKLQILTVNITLPYASSLDYVGSHGSRSYIASSSVSTIERKNDVGERSNGFGVKVNVVRDESLVIKVGQLVSDYMGKRSEVFTGNHLGGYFHQEKITIAPDEARELSQNLEIRHYAEPFPMADGTLVHCNNVVFEATIDRPVEIDRQDCSLLVRFTKIQLVDTRTENVVLELIPNS